MRERSASVEPTLPVGMCITHYLTFCLFDQFYGIDLDR